jgi:hypothetical protein
LRKLASVDRRAISLDVAEIVSAYRALCAGAPRRVQPYFSKTRCGIAPVEANARRREERLAMALFNYGDLPIGDNRYLRVIDYQFPLKARRNDLSVGKVDLLAVTDSGSLAIVELKIETSNEDRRIALLEGLIYAAIVEANIEKIADEAKSFRNCEILGTRPHIVILAASDLWTNPRLFPTLPDFRKLVSEIAEAIPIEIMLFRLDNAKAVDLGAIGSAPNLPGNICLSRV